MSQRSNVSRRSKLSNMSGSLKKPKAEGANDIVPLEISFSKLLLYDWVPFLCQSKQLRALDVVL